MKKILGFLALFITLVAKAQLPTWSDNIACILYTNCTGCHNPNGIANSSFLTYQQVLPYRFGIQVAINNKIMPPYSPNISYQRYTNERVLEQDEIDLINEWVNNGAPEGNPSNAPAAPSYSSSATMQDYDLELQIPTYTVGSVSDIYRVFVLPVNLNNNMYITGWEIVPGNVNIVHHVGIFSDTTNVPFQLDAADPQPGYTRFGLTGSNASVLVGAWVPGQEALYFPNNFGMLLKKNAAILLQIHYPSGVLGQQDSTKIRLKLSPIGNGMRELFTYVPLTHFRFSNGPLRIPANQIKTFYANNSVNNKITIFETFPHMHLIGKSVKSFNITSSNDTIPLLHIPNWNFHWQGSYFFKKPIILLAGSNIYAEVVYDNTSNNIYNPNSPPKLVVAGEGTEDEMFGITFLAAAYMSGDENLIYDTTTTKRTYNNCSYKNIGTITTVENFSFLTNMWSNIYPNPTKDILNIVNKESALQHVRLYNVQGKIVFESINTQTDHIEVSTSSFNKGIYYAEIKTNYGVVRKKVLIE